MNEWEKRYQEGETGWDRGDVSPSLYHWLDRGELKPCRIVVPGCGRGHEVLELARRGFDVTGIDIAPSAIAHMERHLADEGLQTTLILGDLFAQQLEPFDAVYEQTCLCALPPAMLDRYADWLYAHLKPGGKLFALFMQTGAEGGPPYHCDLLAMHKLLDASRWQWPTTTPLITPHRNGRFELGYQLIRK